jgi:glutamate/tyrosine decarboxylase-like PLP-dependent enzyme
MDAAATRDCVDRAIEYARTWLDSLDTRPVGARQTADEALAAFDEPFPEHPMPAPEVVDLLAAAAEPGLLADGSPRFFGFVMGGALPATVGADLLTGVWDQNNGLRAVTPAAAAVEAVAARWIKDALDLPLDATVGYVTGGMMASFTCLGAARNAMLRRRGWDVESLGLQGAPRVRVIVPDERHATIDLSLRYLGLGVDTATKVPTDDQGRVIVSGLRDALDAEPDAPTIVTLQAGNVNTGAFDDFTDAIPLAHEHDAWVHVDGAFGLWAAATPSRVHLAEDMALADSWSTDAHKWLNVPYDCGLAIVADAQAHRSAFGVHADYLLHDAADVDPFELAPEFSRRARGFTVWAALKSLGRSGLADLGENLCAQARRFADQLDVLPNTTVLNDVVLDQVLVRFGDDDTTSRAVVDHVVASGVAYFSPTIFKGQAAARISVCNAGTTDADVDATVAAIERALADVTRGS